MNGTQSTWQCPVAVFSSATPVRKATCCPARLQKLFAGALEGVWLAEDLFAQHGDLVGADDQVSRVAGGKCFGFLPGQALHQRRGGFVIQAPLV